MASDIEQLSMEFSLGLQQISNSLRQELLVISNTLMQEMNFVTNLKQKVEITSNALTTNTQNNITYIDTLTQVQAKVEEVSGGTSKLAGGLSTMASKLFDFVSSSMDSLSGLKAGPDALGAVTDEQAQVAERYKGGLERLDKVLEAVRVRVALGVAPQLTHLADRFLALVDANKELIADGLLKTMTLVGEGIDAVVNFARGVDAVVQATVGWESALTLLGAALGWVGRASILAFAANPIMWVAAALVVVIALVDDFMTYLDGGESALGEFWSPFAKGLRAVNAVLTEFKAQFAAFWAENGETVIAFGEGLMTVIGASISNMLNLIRGVIALFNGDFAGMKKAFDGWIEGLKVQFEVIGGAIKKVASAVGFGGSEEEPKEGAPAEKSGGLFSGITDFFSSGSDKTGAPQLVAGVQDAQSRAALGAGVGAVPLTAPASNNSYNQTVTVHVSGDDSRAIGFEVAEQVARNQQRLTTHNNSSEIRQ
ncbi:hypothetical protein PHLH8_41960 [Pseudomonas sp. Pc102]|nr:hypothetical protein PHLH8_41960 [Pseudomonas sp. Pc102]